mmetsp:Transcript_2826/g.9969  ORF Transcript_2826/g.9969 Transcript_2826/m.9969 type:complete len:229 (+) Transcript_2826:491-1177(+)
MHLGEHRVRALAVGQQRVLLAAAAVDPARDAQRLGPGGHHGLHSAVVCALFAQLLPALLARGENSARPRKAEPPVGLVQHPAALLFVPHQSPAQLLVRLHQHEHHLCALSRHVSPAEGEVVRPRRPPGRVLQLKLLRGGLLGLLAGLGPIPSHLVPEPPVRVRVVLDEDPVAHPQAELVALLRHVLFHAPGVHRAAVGVSRGAGHAPLAPLEAPAHLQPLPHLADVGG